MALTTEIAEYLEAVAAEREILTQRAVAALALAMAEHRKVRFFISPGQILW